MRKLLVALCGAMLLAWGGASPAEAKVTQDQLEQAAAKLLEFFEAQIHSEADAIVLFQAADRNGNGEVTFAEFKKALKPFDLGIKTAVLKQIFRLLEEQFGNGDKKISEEEFLTAVGTLLS